MRKVAVVGLGSWGLCVLERLVHVARLRPDLEVEIDVVEPGKPGGGLFSEAAPDYLVLNTPCGQHSLFPYPDAAEAQAPGTNFFDWVTARGYRWQGDRCLVSGLGREVSPHDFLPRRIMGEYLEWFYEMLVRSAPGNVRVVHYKAYATDVEPVAGRGERVHLDWMGAGGPGAIDVDHVVLTPGHFDSARGEEPRRSRAPAPPGEPPPHREPDAAEPGDQAHGSPARPALKPPSPQPGRTLPTVLRPYPVEVYFDAFAPGEPVAVEGMGLVALDVVTALTTGLGGHYTDAGEGALLYHPSGKEPVLYLFSRTGYPYCAKSPGAADPVGEFEPRIFTASAVAHLRQEGLRSGRALDARAQLVPLIVAEMELRYFSQAALLEGGPGVARQVTDDLAAAWQGGTFGTAKACYGSRYGHFDVTEHIFPGVGRTFSSSEDYEDHVRSTVSADLAEALVGGAASPVKVALETLRGLRDIMRSAVEFDALTLGSYQDFQSDLRARLARPVTGPPAYRNQQLLALMDAGLVRVPFGPSPAVSQDAGEVVVSSTRLARRCVMTFSRMVRAHIDAPSVGRSGAPLLDNLARRGRVRPLSLEGVPVGSIDLSVDCHPVSGRGAEPRIWIFGAPTEGVRYFNLYIPSPKSRARAFVDAETCARQVIGDLDPAEPEPYEAAGRAQSFVARPEASHHEPGSLRAPVGAGRPRQSRGATDGAGGPLRVAFVNNMPDAAFEETESQFRQLLVGWPGPRLDLRCFFLPSITRSRGVRWIAGEHYEDLDQLWDARPEALVVTGAQPKEAELTEEAFWPLLEKLLWWGRSNVGHMMLSCLSAHAGLWVFDSLPRVLLPAKCSGVFAQSVDSSHPLSAGVAPLALPHSRYNGIPTGDVEQAGYRVLAGSPSGWSVAAGRRDGCELVLLQGHPEYHRHTLLREYRRDVRRYLAGEIGSYPPVPTGYLDDVATEALERYRASATDQGGQDLAAGLPFELAASRVTAQWQSSARALMGNWLRSVRQGAPARRSAGQAVQ